MTLMTLPSARALATAAAALAGLALVLTAGWLWYAAGQREASAAYAEALVTVAAAQGVEATPDARAAAAQQLERVLARYPTGPGAAQAAFELGNLRYAERAFGPARGAYEVALARDPSPTLRLLTQAGIGYTWEAEGKYASALEVYRTALAGLKPGGFLYEQLLMSLARAHELLDQRADAIAAYQRVLAEMPATRRGEEVRARLLALGASGG